MLPGMQLSRIVWRPALFLDDSLLRKEGSVSQGRKLTYQALELGSNTLPVILVASVGYFASSYIQFAAGGPAMTSQQYLYWCNDANGLRGNTLNNVATTSNLLGMLCFGFMADRFGRRKMYKYELIVLMAGTIGLLTSSSGYIILEKSNPQALQSADFEQAGSMDIYSWLAFWRFVTGFGTGAEYSLSAVIASEFAPTAKRARILAIVFAMQAIAIGTGWLVSLIVTLIVQSRYPFDAANPASSAQAVDQIWRWVLGLGLIPVTIAAILRFTIPESPRYTLDVLNDPLRASAETERLKQTALESEEESIYSFCTKENDTDSTHLLADTSSGRTPNLTVKQYYWVQGNWRYLLGVAGGWFLFNAANATLSLDEADTLATLWNIPGYNLTHICNSGLQGPDASIYSALISNSKHLLVTDSLPSIVGALLLVFFITHLRRKLLVWTMFLVIGGLYVIMGVALVETAHSTSYAINLALFPLLKFGGTFGIAPFNYLLPAELFPTRYRCSSHSIAAASGRVGALITTNLLGIIAFGNVTKHDDPLTWHGFAFILAIIPMILGAAVTWLWVPDLQHPSGENKTLEELAKGREPSTHQRRGILGRVMRRC